MSPSPSFIRETSNLRAHSHTSIVERITPGLRNNNLVLAPTQQVVRSYVRGMFLLCCLRLDQPCWAFVSIGHQDVLAHFLRYSHVKALHLPYKANVSPTRITVVKTVFAWSGHGTDTDPKLRCSRQGLSEFKHIVEEDAKKITSVQKALRLLRVTPPRFIDADEASLEVKNAMTALSAFAYFIHFPERQFVWSNAIDELRKHWVSSIWPWMEMLVQHVVFQAAQLETLPKTKEGLDLHEKITWVTPLFYVLIYTHPAGDAWNTKWDEHVAEIVSEHIGTFLLLWWCTIRLSHPSLPLHTICFRQLFWTFDRKFRHELIQYVIQHGAEGSLTWLVEFVAFSGHGHSSIECLEFALHVFSLCCEVDENVPTITSCGGIQVLTGLLRHLVVNSNKRCEKSEPLDILLLIASIKWVLMSLCDIFRLVGNQGVISALEGRLLLSMVEGSTFLGYEAQHANHEIWEWTKTVAASALVSTLVQYSLKKIVGRDQEIYSIFLESSNAAHADTEGTSHASRSWKELLDQSEEIRKRWQAYKREVSFCTNTECPRLPSDRGIIPRRCSRCKIAFYCSRKCQKQDWKLNNHRGVCDESAEWTKGACMPVEITDLERNFFSWLITDTVKMKREEFKARISSERFPNRQKNPPLFILNFREIPASAMFISASEYLALYAADPIQNPITREDCDTIAQLNKQGHSERQLFIPSKLKEITEEDLKEVRSMRGVIRVLKIKPPEAIDPDDPSTLADIKKVVTALSAMTCLMHYVKPVHIWQGALNDVKKNLATLIWPWTSLLLHHFVFDSTHTQPTQTLDSLDIRQKLVWIVPAFMSFGNDHPAGPTWRESWTKHVIRTIPESFPVIARL
ncbi:hypothetical protein D9758_014958 [Tetrapyrgos nigripes]|uniref:phytol kinase n=1 Tax=Tetrapyrgos nigripes TaxID=182062 RepID=A0A8H5CJH0_9AGAR|nr:hypothetical protein D9758_014958 [Tetrapyrgos nigripes]